MTAHQRRIAVSYFVGIIFFISCGTFTSDTVIVTRYPLHYLTCYYPKKFTNVRMTTMNRDDEMPSGG